MRRGNAASSAWMVVEIMGEANLQALISWLERLFPGKDASSLRLVARLYFELRFGGF